ncbi:hypothetical protein SAMD00019534_045670, partial [Acytostelium subglobosum LB1]|uniref:hypothetical protein n=1 Tax=Acytostelium subglobosum LB1 TaxID=1410327 RepID=UPI000644A3C4
RDNKMTSTTTSDIKIILGSSSIWRKKVLSDHMGYTFTTMSPDIDEKAIRDPDARKLTMMISNAKADALLSKVKEPAILICSDQVIVHNNIIREKPDTISTITDTKDICREYLRSYEFHPAECIASVVVVNTQTGKRVQGTDVASMYFKRIPEEVIERLIAQGDVMNCAGGFTAEHMEEYIDRCEGEFETVMGLPKTMTARLIEEAKNS